MIHVQHVPSDKQIRLSLFAHRPGLPTPRVIANVRRLKSFVVDEESTRAIIRLLHLIRLASPTLICSGFSCLPYTCLDFSHSTRSRLCASIPGLVKRKQVIHVQRARSDKQRRLPLFARSPGPPTQRVIANAGAITSVWGAGRVHAGRLLRRRFLPGEASHAVIDFWPPLSDLGSLASPSIFTPLSSVANCGSL